MAGLLVFVGSWRYLGALRNARANAAGGGGGWGGLDRINGVFFVV